MEKYAVIVAGGSGTRMGAQIPKQFLLLKGKPVLWHTLTAFLASFPDLRIILVLPGRFISEGQAVADITTDPLRITIIEGGDTRFQSVKNSLRIVPDDSIVFVHDGVRCLITPALIRLCYEEAVEKGNAIPAVKAVDSVRISTAEGNKMIDRREVHLIQTPQTFISRIIKDAFKAGYQDIFTDEASVAEYAGQKIHLVEGEANNLKITRPIDLHIAEKILEEREHES